MAWWTYTCGCGRSVECMGSNEPDGGRETVLWLGWVPHPYVDGLYVCSFPCLIVRYVDELVIEREEKARALHTN